LRDSIDENASVGGGVLVTWWSLASPPTDAARTTTMYVRWHVPSVSATPWDDADSSSLTPAQRLVMEEQREAYRRAHEPGPRDAEFFNGYPRAKCPRCGSPEIKKNGFDARGVRRYLCRRCGRSFSPLTGTVFEDHRIALPGWFEFLLGIMSYESLAGIARRDRRSPTTPPYQLAKVFMVLDGIQDGVVLSGRVQMDEMMYKVPAVDRDPALAGRRAGGYSRDNTCVAIACEERDGGASVFRVLGRGKPSGERAKAAYCRHLSRGLELVHDRENSHRAVVRELGLASEAHDSREIKGLPDDENPLWKVNRLCFLLRLFLDGHSGFDRANFAGWLDLFWVMMNPPEDRLEKVAMVLDRAMASPNTLRYRDFYKQRGSSSS